MEPLSGLAIATSVVQFVDFTSKILAESRELYKSSTGLSKDHAELHVATTTLLNLSQTINRPLSSTGSSPHHAELQVLCQNVHQVAQELFTVLDNIRREDIKQEVSSRQQRNLPIDESRLDKVSKWDSCLKALRSVWSQEQIGALAQKLQDFRQQLTLSAVVILREEVYSSQASVKDNVALMHKEFVRYVDDNLQWRTELAKELRKQHDRNVVHNVAPFSPRNIADFGLKNASTVFARHILTSLRFDSIEDRYDRIPQRHRETYEWIFRSTNPEGGSWTNFAQWLQDSSRLYWVTGKAGSGKSTLMKFLQDDPRTAQILASSTDLPIITAGYFFWNSGAEMQMSQIGLLRTLLSQLLEQCEEWAPIAFPYRWEEFSLLGYFSFDDWSVTELHRGLLRLLQPIARSHLVFFIIDGLDEYSGAHFDLVAFLKELASNQSLNIKMCLSSRPWIVFEDAFNRTPSLTMQEFTLPDMLLYATERFGDNPGFQELAKEEPIHSEQLVRQIAEKASGVFLWVTLVVKSLLIGLSNGDGVDELLERLDDLPGDLEELFQKIIDNIDPAYRRHASELFQIFRAATPPSSILTLAFAEQIDLQSALRQPIELIPAKRLQSKIERTRRRLNSRCRGLLEVTGRNIDILSQVSYLHRTVKDFMEDKERWEKITAITASDFDPNLHLSKSYLMRLKVCNYPDDFELLSSVMNASLNYATAASDAVTDDRIRLADAVDATVNEIASTKTLDGKSLHEHSVRLYPTLKPHWVRDHITSLVLPRMQQPSSFANYMIYTGRQWYVKEKLSRGMDARQPRPLVPLLFSAANPTLIVVRDNNGEEPLQLVQSLLTHGADPNESFQGDTLLRLAAEVSNEGLKKELEALLKAHGAVERNCNDSAQAKSSKNRTVNGASHQRSTGDDPKARKWSFRVLFSRSSRQVKPQT